MVISFGTRLHRIALRTFVPVCRRDFVKRAKKGPFGLLFVVLIITLLSLTADCSSLYHNKHSLRNTLVFITLNPY